MSKLYKSSANSSGAATTEQTKSTEEKKEMVEKPATSPFFVMDWKLTPAESQTPSVSWRQSLTDDGSGLQANKLASSMTNPDNISNYEAIGGMGAIDGVSGSTDIEAGDMKSYMEESYAAILKYKSSGGRVGGAASTALQETPGKVTAALKAMKGGTAANGLKYSDYTDIIINVSKEKKVDPLLVLAIIAQETLGVPCTVSSDNGKGLMQVTSSALPAEYYSTNDMAKKIKIEISYGIDILKGKKNCYNYRDKPFSYITAYNCGENNCRDSAKYYKWEEAQTTTSIKYFAKICVAYHSLLGTSGTNKLVTAQGNTTEYRLPVTGGKYLITDTWRWRSSSRFHSGIDVGTPIGTPLYAIADCTVTFSGAQDGYGKCVEIELKNILNGKIKYVLYGHMSKLTTIINKTLKKGDIIGYSGNTGIGSGPHLHFECRKVSSNTGPSNTVNPSVLYPSAGVKLGKLKA